MKSPPGPPGPANHSQNDHKGSPRARFHTTPAPSRGPVASPEEIFDDPFPVPDRPETWERVPLWPLPPEAPR